MIVGILLAFGFLQIVFVERAPDFLRDDAFYADAARALMQQHFYGINGRPETNMPPGLSGLLALLCMVSVCGHVAVLRAMAVLQTLGFLASYLFLRRVAPRWVAGLTCVILISSPIYFAQATEWLVAFYPYFVVTMCALLVARHVESTEAYGRQGLLWTGLLALLCAASVMMASAGIALIVALVVRAIIVSAVGGRAGLRVVRRYALAAAAGTVFQALWMRRTPAPLEWPLAGYPRPYLQQLLVKSGNYPELGMATLRDIPERIASNAVERSAFLSQLLLRHWIDPHWASFAPIVVFSLIILGWCRCLRSTGGEVHDWYFAGHEFIYLLWPWSLEPRFFLPVAPLACLYLWEGARTVGRWLKASPRRVGRVWLPIAAILVFGSAAWIGSSNGVTSVAAGAQARLSLALWVISGLFATWLAWRGQEWATPLRRFDNRLAPGLVTTSQRSLRAARIGAWLVAVILVAIGFGEQLRIARANIDLHSDVNRLTADAEAGIWLHTHTDARSVVMARYLPTTLHYSARREVWFPPSSNPQLLMEGIRRLKVDYVVVVHRDENYYLPSDDSSFDHLVAAYPQQFCLAYATTRFSIFRTRRGEGA